LNLGTPCALDQAIAKIVESEERARMSGSLPHIFSRRAALTSLAVAAAYRIAIAGPNPDRATTDDGAGPVFSPSGPNAEHYGAAEAFPIADPLLAHQPGTPLEPKYRVGAFSHGDEIFPTRRIARAATPWMFKRSQQEIRYSYGGTSSSVTDYLSRNPVTGLLIAKDDQILFEHYQYARTDRDRFFSGSMVKSITGMLIGIAMSEGAIKSVDDTTETYVPGFRGTEYGKTPIRDLLHMSSGVEFREGEDGGRDLDRLWIDMVRGSGKGTVNSIVQFNRRIAAPGTRYFYASIEPDVLGVVLHYATDRTASDYLHQKVWEPIGAEADATWMVDAEGFEVAHTNFNAVLRDYARLGRLFAHDGAWNGKQVIPAQWMIDATTVRASETYLAPGRAGPGSFGYGYLVWLLPGTARRFAFISDFGQRIFVDPSSKLVMVQTALETPQKEVMHLWAALVEQFG
jgi:CubicO group peptidase (beta-lactamase class C family)